MDMASGVAKLFHAPGLLAVNSRADPRRDRNARTINLRRQRSLLICVYSLDVDHSSVFGRAGDGIKVWHVLSFARTIKRRTLNFCSEPARAQVMIQRILTNGPRPRLLPCKRTWGEKSGRSHIELVNQANVWRTGRGRNRRI